MIDIKSIIEEIEFQDINNLLEEFENESERLEFENMLEAYKYQVLSDKEKIILELKNIKKEENRKEEISYDSDYSLLPNSLKVSLSSLAELNTKAIIEGRVFYTIKFKKSLNFDDYYEILKDIDKYQDDKVLNTVKKLFNEELLMTYKDIKRYGINNIADVLKFPRFEGKDEERLYQDYLHKKPKMARDFQDYLNELYSIGINYYKKEYPRMEFETLDDIRENLKQSELEILGLKDAIFRGIKDTDIINITSNIFLSRERIKDVFRKNNENNTLLVDKFIDENTKDREILEEEKAEVIKNKIYFNEIDRVYKSKNKRIK